MQLEDVDSTECTREPRARWKWSTSRGTAGCGHSEHGGGDGHGAGGELLDRATLPPDSRAHRAAGVASNVIKPGRAEWVFRAEAGVPLQMALPSDRTSAEAGPRC